MQALPIRSLLTRLCRREGRRGQQNKEAASPGSDRASAEEELEPDEEGEDDEAAALARLKGKKKARVQD